MDEGNRENKRRRTLLIAILFLGIIALFFIGMTLFLWRENKKLKEALSEKSVAVDTLEIARANLLHELTTIREEYGKLKTDNEALNAKIEEQKRTIDSLIAEVKKGKLTYQKYKQALEEIETLKKIARHYQNVIDSLNRINQQLAEENVKYKKGLEESKQKVQELTAKKEQLEQKVKIGERLKLTKLEAIPGFMRRGTKFVDTKRHKKVEVIKICVSIDENVLAPTRKYALYGRVIAPSGSPLVEAEDEQHTFKFEGSHGYFSFKREFDYEGSKIEDWCIYYEPKVELMEGKYIVELYIEDYRVGTTEFTLK